MNTMHKRFTKLFNLLLLCFITQLVVAQPTFIQFQFPAYANDTVVLAHYFNSKVFVNDTLFLNENGIGSFASKTALPQGIYCLYFNQNELVDFLIGEDQQFMISRNEGQIEISGAKESQWFQNYVDFLNEKKKKLQHCEQPTNNWMQNQTLHKAYKTG